MRIPFLLFAAVLLGPSAWAQHEEEHPYYFELGLGGVFSEDAQGVGFDPGFSSSLAVGRGWEVSERLDFEAEVEAFYQSFKFDEDDLPSTAAADDRCKTLAFMLNGVFDWEFTQQYSVYGGAGVGWAKEVEYGAFNSDDELAYQGLFGFAYNLGGTSDLRLGYRYFTADVDEVDASQHSVEATFRWALGL
jgi:opacity protein-like surface antigen